MDHQTSGSSYAMKVLLNRQLASITDTLAKASQQREAEVKRRTTPKPTASPSVQILAIQSPISDLSLISDTDASAASDSGHSGVMFEGHQKGFEHSDLGMPQSSSIMSGIRSTLQEPHTTMTDTPTDDSAFHVSLRGYVSEDDDEPMKMLAELRQIDPMTSAHDNGPESDIDPQRLLAEFDRPTSCVAQATAGVETEDTGPKEMLVELEGKRYKTKEVAVCGDSGDDLSQMPAELRRRAQGRDEETVNDDSDNDPRMMLADTEGGPSSSDHATIDGADDDPKRMLADLECRAPLFKREPTKDDDDNDEEEDYEALRVRLANLVSFSRQVERRDATTTCTCEPVALDKAVIPYAVAIQLETSGQKWDVAKGWATYLFSSGLAGHEAQREKHTSVRRATEELNQIIQNVMEEEKRHHDVEYNARLPRRLIVSNIAADADKEDLVRLLHKFRFDVQEITFLQERDPVRRTKSAHIDMYTRRAAIQASFTVGSIFGLLLDIKLAVGNES